MLRITNVRRRLNDQELNTARLASQGLSNKEMATTLGLTERTVKGYVLMACRIMGFRSRFQLAVWYLQYKDALQTKRLLDLAAQVGCRAVWFAGHEGGAWHCNCDDVRHSVSRESALITFESLEDNQ